MNKKINIKLLPLQKNFLKLNEKYGNDLTELDNFFRTILIRYNVKINEVLDRILFEEIIKYKRKYNHWLYYNYKLING